MGEHIPVHGGSVVSWRNHQIILVHASDYGYPNPHNSCLLSGYAVILIGEKDFVSKIYCDLLT